MKILYLVFHPDLSNSKVNREWKSQIDGSGIVSVSRDMYSEYPDFNIDVEKEQELLLEHDRIVLQFPLYWYSCTPLLKKWLDDVLSYNFAYGSKGGKLKGKDLQLILSVGGQEKFYSGFDIYATLYELLRPFQLTANFCQMNYSLPVWMYRADVSDLKTIRSFGEKWIQVLKDPLRSEGKAFLNSIPDDTIL